MINQENLTTLENNKYFIVHNLCFFNEWKKWPRIVGMSAHIKCIHQVSQLPLTPNIWWR